MHAVSRLSPIIIAMSMAACGSDESGAPNGSAGSGSGETGGSGAFVEASCDDDVFVKLDAPYTANDTIADMVIADADGLVLSPLEDASQIPDSSQWGKSPNQIVTIDMQGKSKTIWTDDTNMPLRVAADANNVYFWTMGEDILAVPRAGGDATVLVEGVYEGPVLVDGKLYYAGNAGDGNKGVFEIDTSGGSPNLLSDRGSLDINGFSAFAADKDSVYWVETSDHETYTLYQFHFADASVDDLGAVSSDMDELMIGDGDLYFGGITESYEYQLRRFVPGGDPVTVVEETTGAIEFTDDAVYYASYSGLVRTPFDFSVTSTMAGTAGMDIAAIAVGPKHVWYSEHNTSCIYRMPRE